MNDAPLFEVTAPTADAAARRLTTAEKVRAVIGSPASDNALIETMIDRVSAAAAKYCRLAEDAVGTFPTFGRETCRATWYANCRDRDSKLLLPWRVPIISITSIVEDGETLTEGDDYKLFGGAIVERLSSDAPVCWSRCKIVVTYVTGWDLTQADQVPPDLEAAVIEQTKVMYQTRQRDPTLRQEATQDVGSATYSVPGGDSIGANGLTSPVEAALDSYRNWAAT